MLAIYTRRSKEDPTSNSIENQLREGKDFAQKNNHQFKHYNEGDGISGGADVEDRPALQELLDDIYNDLIDAVWVRKQDRLERNTSTFLLFTDLTKKKNIEVYINGNANPINYEDPDSFFQGGIMSMFNSYLIKKQSLLTRNAIKRNFQLGYTHGVPNYGYKRLSKENRKMVIDEEEADVVRDIFKWSLAGDGFVSIAKKLNTKEIPTTYNKIGKGEKKNTKWSDSSVRGIIKKEIYKGIRKAKDGTVYESPVIIEPYLWDKVNDNLVKNMTGGVKKTIHKYLLNDVNKCGVCGKPYTGRALKSKHVLYRCVSKRNGKHNCGNASARLEVVDRLVWDIYFKNKHMLDLVNKEYQIESDMNISYDALQKIKELEETKNELTQQKKVVVLAVSTGKLKQMDIREVIDDIDAKIYDADNQMYDLMKLVEKHTDIMKNNITKKNELEEVDTIDTFEGKKQLIEKYIKEVTITKLPNQHIKTYLHFKAENLESDAIIIDRNYNWTYEPNRMNLVDMDGNRFDPETDVKMIKEIDIMFNYYKDLYE